ncbi:hypothetical protein LOK49_LG02G01364 [Camellia lanceoleosa]|uniref:Uncharacterized protein n=1 Tax=Camellia lanceoleosa TaxID=1840588 RepID=A0ACC0IQG1_9ERIC|nr:hypothetical protein LOK49_LG02G01364 [Camellia lanceoleosa]
MFSVYCERKFEVEPVEQQGFCFGFVEFEVESAVHFEVEFWLYTYEMPHVTELDMDSSRNPESGEDRRVIAPQETCNQIAEVVHEALKKMEMVADEKMRMFKKAHQSEASELELDEKARKF